MEPGCEGAATRQQKEGVGTLQWGVEYALLCSSGVTGKVAASISDRRGNGLCMGERALDMGVSRTNFHPDSECQLRGLASPDSPHCPTPSNAQSGLSDAPQGSLSHATQQSQGTG